MRVLSDVRARSGGTRFSRRGASAARWASTCRSLTYFAFMPVILLVMQLPITINGLGTTQVAFERLFVPAGVPEAPAFALSLLFLALGILGSLPGGVLYALSPAQPAPGESRV